MGGKNLSSGFEKVEEIVKKGELPTRIDWISKNPHSGGDKRPSDDVEKTIYEVKEDGTVTRGTIVQKSGGTFDFGGEFKVNGTFKNIRELTQEDKQKILSDFELELAALNALYHSPEIVKCDDDADRDGITNGAEV